MKRLGQILTAAVLSVAFVGASAGAQVPNCDVLVINATGPESNNQIICEVEENVTVVCQNGVYVLDENSQEAVTGAASNQGNVTSGTAITGNATNENNQTVEIGSTCGSVTSPSPSPSASPSPSVTPTATKPAALPFTSGNDASSIVVASLAMAAVVVAVSRLAIAAYRRISIK